MHRDSGWERKFLPSWAEGYAEAGLGVVGFVEAVPAICACREMESLEGGYPKGTFVGEPLAFFLPL